MSRPLAAPAAVHHPLRLSARVQRAKPSMILGINARAKQLIAEGKDVLLFGAGEPDFATPAHVREATAQAMERGFTRYTASAGIAELRQAVVDTLQRDTGLRYGTDQVIVTTGAKMALYELFQSICEEGDEVILFGPYWGSYADIIALSGARPVIVQTSSDDGFVPDPEAVRRALTPRTRAVLINSPCNPTGVVYDKATLEQLARVLEPTNCLVVSDDIYAKIIYDGRPFQNMAQLSADWYARTVVISGVSKTYSMTGFRIGWAAGPRDVISAMGRVQDQSTSGPTAFSQMGALAALTGDQTFVKPMAAEFQRRRDAIVSGLNQIPGVHCVSPGGAFYAFPSVGPLLGRRFEGRTIATPMQLCELLLEHFGLALVPGEPFGTPDHVRLSFATGLDEITRGVARLKDALAQLE